MTCTDTMSPVCPPENEEGGTAAIPLRLSGLVARCRAWRPMSERGREDLKCREIRGRN